MASSDVRYVEIVQVGLIASVGSGDDGDGIWSLQLLRPVSPLRIFPLWLGLPRMDKGGVTQGASFRTTPSVTEERGDDAGLMGQN